MFILNLYLPVKLFSFMLEMVETDTFQETVRCSILLKIQNTQSSRITLAFKFIRQSFPRHKSPRKIFFYPKRGKLQKVSPH